MADQRIRVGYRQPDRERACQVCGHNWWDKVPGRPFEMCRYCADHGKIVQRFVRVLTGED
jgi:hypothetical protein